MAASVSRSKSIPAGALIAAVKKEDIVLVRNLLDAGADVNEQATDTLNTPLHWAAYYNLTDIADLLLSRGANIEAQDKNGMTPLHDAVAFTSPKMVTLLLRRGASVNAPNTAGDTPLHLAAMFNETSAIAESLIEAGAALDVKNEDEQTPLYCAADENHLETTALLLAYNPSAAADPATAKLLRDNFDPAVLKDAVERALQTPALARRSAAIRAWRMHREGYMNGGRQASRRPASRKRKATRRRISRHSKKHKQSRRTTRSASRKN